MIRSMTAFAKSSYEGKDFTMDVFIRTYNHRYLDINLKLPLELLHLEGELRSLISRYLSRGRVEMTVKATFLKEGIYQVLINKPLVAKLIHELQSMKGQLGIISEIELGSLLRIPGLIETQTDVQKISRETLDEIKEIIDTCLKSLLQMRAQEGQILAGDISERFDSLTRRVDTIESNSQNHPQDIQSRLEKSLKEVFSVPNVDPNRLMQEVAYYAERSDVTEELVRLRSHILQCKKLIDGTEVAGRKLEFLLQEILREVNTVGSKSDLLVVSQTVIEMKTELEKIREQIQNVE
jgi:uncharacterized protein (TIGR00255 family)